MQRVIHVTGANGHTDVLFRSKTDVADGEKLKKDEVDEAAAREVFDIAMKAGRVAIADGNVVETFDPKAKEITIVSQLAGG